MKEKTSFQGSKIIAKVISLLLLMSIILSGCRLPWQQGEESSQTQETEGVGPETIDGDTSPTEEPRSDLPPALVEVTPPPQKHIDLEDSITLYFNQPMDTDSVEAAIQFEPRVSGRFSWEEDQFLTFTPDQAFAPSSQLHLIVNTSAQAANRKNLQSAIELDFQTAEVLKVLQVVPADGAQDVDPSGSLFVVFNQPVVPLGAGDSQDPAFRLMPEVSGEGKWLNTSTYVFQPDPTLDGGTDYILQINESLVAVSGAMLASDQALESTFTTNFPKVLQVLPLSGELLSLDGPVTVQFNIAMDPNSVEENFALIGADGQPVEGEFEWDDGQKTVAFTPEENLRRSSIYTVQIGETAQSYGGIPLGMPVETTHATNPIFTVNTFLQPEFKSYSGDFGNYIVHFTTPINSQKFKDTVSIDPGISAKSVYLTDDDTALNISGYFAPNTSYTITIDADFSDRWGGDIGEIVTQNFTTPSSPPSFTIATGPTPYNLLFVPAATPELILQATNINSLVLEIAPISQQDLITLLNPENFDYRQVFLPENLDIHTHNLELAPNISEVVRIPLDYQDEPLSPGIYYVGVNSPEVVNDWPINQKYYVIVSKNNLVFKLAPDQAMIWATTLVDNSPLTGVPVNVVSTEGDFIVSGQTDDAGLFISDYDRLDDAYMNFIAFAGEPGQDDFGFSFSSWNQGSALFQNGITLQHAPPVLDGFLYTDRPLYKPGDTLHFKAVIFNRDNNLPVQVDFDSVDVKVFGDYGISGIPPELFSEELALSAYGTVEGAVNLPEDGSPGLYFIELSHDGVVFQVKYFSVATYRKPTIELEVGLQPAEIIVGDNLDGYVQADYYFGMAASDQPFTWSLFLDDGYFDLPGYRVGPMDTDWLDPRQNTVTTFGELIQSGEGDTGVNGQYSFDFNSETFGGEDARIEGLKEITLEVTVIDENGFPVSYRDVALLHPEKFYIGVKPETYFGRVGDALNFSVLTVDHEKKAFSNLAVNAIFEKITWEVEETNNPGMPYRYVSQTTFVNSADPITNADGAARLSFTPEEPGTYRLSLRSGDALTQMLIWVTGASNAVWPNQSQNLISLTTDKEIFQIGDTAEIFFPNPFNNPGVALVTVERGRVMTTQVVEVTGSGTTISLPITEDFLPNVYVSVMLLGKNDEGKPDFRQGVINLPVDPISMTLNVDLSLDATTTAPGEIVSARLTVTNQDNVPVEGEFSIAVVDKALLALVDDERPSILEALYGNQMLAVDTSFSLRTYAMQLALSAYDVGGQGGGGGMAETTLREDFPDTAFWRGMVTTDGDGQAYIQLPLPDSLTTWVVTVIGLTDSYQVGQGEAEIVTQKALMIKPATPRFLVEGDIVEIAATVYNNTSQDLDVATTIEGAGFKLNDQTAQSQQIKVSAGQGEQVTWWGRAEGVDSLDLVFRASSGQLSDSSRSEWGSLDVKSFTTPYTFSTAGQLSEAGQILEVVSLPISSNPDQGDLVLELTPSLLSTLLEGLEVFERSSSSDVLSIAARLGANFSIFNALSQFGIESPQLEDDLSFEIDEGIRRLIEAQSYDGGWSLWSRNPDSEIPSDPFTTAFALLSLEMVAKAGWIDETYFLDRAALFLTEQIKQPGEISSTAGLDELSFVLYALRGHEMNWSLYLDGLYDRRTELSSWALALLGLTTSDIDTSPQRVRSLLGDLETRAIRSATGLHWEDENPAWYLPGNTIYNTALGVFALSQLDPASSSLPLGVQYLMHHRDSAGVWVSDFVSAWSLMAIIEALKGTGDFQTDYVFNAMVNDTVMVQGLASGTSSQTAVSATVPIDSLHPNHPNALEISRDAGPGTLYYRVDLHTYQPAMSAKAIDGGINLERAYYMTGSNCPGTEDCASIDSITLDAKDPDQLIRVALTMIIPHDMYHVVVEDPIPAGTEIFNPEFVTSQSIPFDPGNVFDPIMPFKNGWGWWIFNHPKIFEDHIQWTASYVPAGTYILTYDLMPTQRGAFQVLPTHAWQYFYPEVQGTTSGDLFTIN